jgi:hypothetical protein
MTPYREINKVQRITIRLVVLNIFISRLGECSLSFFKILKNIIDFE